MGRAGGKIGIEGMGSVRGGEGVFHLALGFEAAGPGLVRSIRVGSSFAFAGLWWHQNECRVRAIQASVRKGLLEDLGDAACFLFVCCTLLALIPDDILSLISNGDGEDSYRGYLEYGNMDETDPVARLEASFANMKRFPQFDHVCTFHIALQAAGGICKELCLRSQILQEAPVGRGVRWI